MDERAGLIGEGAEVLTKSREKGPWFESVGGNAWKKKHLGCSEFSTRLFIPRRNFPDPAFVILGTRCVRCKKFPTSCTPLFRLIDVIEILQVKSRLPSHP